MPSRKKPDPKTDALRARGCLNSRPERVADDVFASDDFFDARDIVQVKYEMLRRAEVDGISVKAAAAAFGFSRPSFYQARTAVEREGVAGLVPAKPGPRRAHKLSEEVVDYVLETIADGEVSRSTELAQAVKDQFDIDVHPRSIERAIARREKKTAR